MKEFMRAILIAWITSFGLAGCLHVRVHDAERIGIVRCRDGEQKFLRVQLYFGRDRGPQQPVSAADWQAFLNQEITPRFPDGLTWHDAQGQWRGADQRIVQESSFVLTLLIPATADRQADLETIVSVYRQRFQQEAVLRERSTACVTF